MSNSKRILQSHHARGIFWYLAGVGPGGVPSWYGIACPPLYRNRRSLEQWNRHRFLQIASSATVLLDTVLKGIGLAEESKLCSLWLCKRIGFRSERVKEHRKSGEDRVKESKPFKTLLSSFLDAAK